MVVIVPVAVPEEILCRVGWNLEDSRTAADVSIHYRNETHTRNRRSFDDFVAHWEFAYRSTTNRGVV